MHLPAFLTAAGAIASIVAEAINQQTNTTSSTTTAISLQTHVSIPSTPTPFTTFLTFPTSNPSAPSNPSTTLNPYGPAAIYDTPHSTHFLLHGRSFATTQPELELLLKELDTCHRIKHYKAIAYHDPELLASSSLLASQNLSFHLTAKVPKIRRRCLNHAIQLSGGPENALANEDSDARVEVQGKKIDIWGRGFAGDRQGVEALIDRIKGCGRVEEFRFVFAGVDGREDESDGWDFLIEGDTGKFKRKCLNRAIREAGGPLETISEEQERGW